MQCGECKFCCWSFTVADIPDSVATMTLKPGCTHCPFECDKGCSIHDEPNFPQGCLDFICPYLEGENIHRPDSFQELLERLNGNVGSYIPAIHTSIPIAAALRLIEETRTIPAFILGDKEWIKVVLSLDRMMEKTWMVNVEAIEKWDELFRVYGCDLGSAATEGIGVGMYSC